jgi:hypothetical protein
MLKKLLVLTAVLIMSAGFYATASADETAAAATTTTSSAAASAASAALDTGAKADSGPSVKVGGHVKMMVFDRPAGIVTNAGTQVKIDRSFGVWFNELDLLISAKLSDLVSFEIDPRFSSSTGATPKIGVTTTAVSSGMSFAGMAHGVAEIILNLPYDVRMEAGQLRPMFSYEYGSSVFMDEEWSIGKSMHEDLIGMVEDYGVGFYRNFDLKGLAVSVPVYAYILNGPATGYTAENNNQPGGMLHIEPTYGPFTLLGSFNVSKWDDKELYTKTQWLAGGIFKWAGLTIRSEFARGKQENAIAKGTDAWGEGYYAKVLYKVFPWIQLMYHFDSALENSTKDAPFQPARLKTRYITNSAGAQIYLTDSTIIQAVVEVGDDRTEDGSRTLVYTRPYIAIQSTF